MEPQGSKSTSDAYWLDPHNADSPSAIVGIGASAGGLEALETLFDSMPTETGLAFVRDSASLARLQEPDGRAAVAAHQDCASIGSATGMRWSRTPSI